MTHKDTIQLYELLVALHEGDLTDEQFMLLNEKLKDKASARDYVEFVTIMSGLACPSEVDFYFQHAGHTELQEEDNQDSYIRLMRELAEKELSAPSIEFTEEKAERELIQNLVYPQKEEQKVSVFQIFTFLTAAAAILFVILFIKLAPIKQYSVEVATVLDQMNVKWADSNVSLQNGESLWTNEGPWNLEKGFVVIQYNDGVDVVIEGPSVFDIDQSRLTLEYGRAFSKVSKTGLGFTVKTPTSQFVDMGTEFGVQADVDGSSELHVIKGKVQLFAGSREQSKQSMMVTENKAVRFNANNGGIDNIPVEVEAFARSIDSSKTNVNVWRGQNLSLASIVAGDNGFHPVGSLVGLNPISGKFTTSVVSKRQLSNNTYNPVPQSAFIDGVFVPGSKSNMIPVTSLGQTFNCPNTSGKFTHEIAVYKGTLEGQNTTIPPVIINDEEVVDNPILMLHSNIGITIDLQAIRDSLPHLDIKGFKATGVAMKEYTPDIDFWVLVDGKIRYEKRIIQAGDSPISLDLKFNPQDRFLTLIVTEGAGLTDDTGVYPYSSDFFYLIDPELSLANKP